MTDNNSFSFQLLQVSGDAVSEDIRDWEEVYNEVFILAPGRNPEKKMTFHMKEYIMKNMTHLIIANDRKYGTNNFHLLYEKHKSLIARIGTIGILLKNQTFTGK